MHNRNPSDLAKQLSGIQVMLIEALPDNTIAVNRELFEALKNPEKNAETKSREFEALVKMADDIREGKI